MRPYNAALIIGCLLFAAPALADEITLEGTPEQGALIRGMAAPGAHVALDGKPVRVAPDGRFIFGFGRDAPEHASLDVVFADGTRLHRDLVVAIRQYDIRRIDGLPPAQVSPSPEAMIRIKREQVEIDRALAVESDNLAFEAPLIWPVLGPISGIFGSQTIMNGESRSPHYGVDVAAPAGSPVRASNAGRIVLAEPDLYFTGGTVIIDHGYGLSTTYVHLQHMAVRRGDRVRQGQPIGEVGSTGRATGPNLHWGVNWGGVRLDPALVAGPMPALNPASGDAARASAPGAPAPSAPPSH